MKRRKFIALAIGAVAWPRQVDAQERRALPRVGLLLANEGPAWNGILQSLTARGFVEGKTIKIEHRQAEGRLERLPELARELVALPVDVLVSVAASATVAARQATSSIPIVMVHAGDPIGQGLIDSLARPGGNVTGTTSYSEQLVTKAVDLLRELAPSIQSLAMLVVPSNSGTRLAVQQAQLAATRFGFKLKVVGVERAEDLEAAFSEITRVGSDALLVSGEPMLFTNRSRVVGFAARAGLPTIYTIGEFVRDGGLIGYGPIFGAHHQLAADYVERILKGAKPSELPVAQPTHFELVINLKTAQALGLTVPPTLLARADEVIE
jgi:putative ABC transport system substrate-binding protein